MGMKGLLDINTTRATLLWTTGVGMTGGQDNPATAATSMAARRRALTFFRGWSRRSGSLPERIHVVDPYQLPVLFKTIRDEVKVPEVSVIVTDRALRPDQGDHHKLKAYEVIDDKCTGCGNCIDVGCPAIHATRSGKVSQTGAKSTLAFRAHRDVGATGCGLAAAAPNAIVHHSRFRPVRLVKGRGV